MQQLYKKLLPLFIFLFLSVSTFATHIVGGTLTYEYLGGASYRITLKLYRSCAAGSAVFDKTATVEIRKGNGGTFTTSKNVTMSLVDSSYVNPYIDTCAVKPNICILEAIYSKVVNNLPPLTGGYHLYYQRCCRNSVITNLANPLNDGISVNTYIPDNSLVLSNSSPSWISPPPTFVCVGKSINYNHAATDLDGDSLVYSFYHAYDGCSPGTPAGPGCPGNAPTYPGGNAISFTPVTYAAGYTASSPLSPVAGNNLTLSASGLLGGIPTTQGYYVVGIKCSEYRDGVKIGEIVRDYQYIAIACPPLAQANFTTSLPCYGQNITFTNTSDTVGATGGSVDYLWNFGDPTVTTDSSVAQHPGPYTYPGSGPYTATLIINPRTGCADTATQVITISNINAAYTSPDSTCVTNGIPFTNGSTVASNATITNYNWNFGDAGSGGSNTSTAQNPTHTFSYGGTATNYTVTLIVTSSVGCKDTIQHTVKVMGLPIVNAHDTTSCSNNAAASINGTVLNATGGTWTVVPAPPSLVPGSLSPNANVLTPTYTPTPDDIAQGHATLVLTSTGNTMCPSRQDTMKLTFTPGPTANAGPNAFVCKDTLYIPLQGVVTIAGGGTWSPIMGSTGTINNPTSLTTAQYVPSAGDLTAGVAFVQLLTTSNGSCGPSRDTVSIFFANSPTAVVTATNDTSCAPAAVAITGTSSTGTSIWTTSGDGAFADSSLASTSYTPGANDISNGSLTLYYSSTNNGGCKGAKDSLKVAVLSIPTVNAGSDAFVCQDTVYIPLTGTMSAVANIQWIPILGSTGTVNNPTSLTTAQYVPSANDLTNGSAFVLLQTTSNASCTPAMDTVKITFAAAPTAVISATNDTSCVPLPINIFGTSSTGSSIWTSSGDGIFADSSLASTTYTPGTADAAAGSLTLYYSSANNGGCRGGEDSIKIFLLAQPTAFAGPDAFVCQDTVYVPLTGSVTIAGGGTWTPILGSTGTINNPTSLTTAQYVPSAADITNGFAYVQLQTNINGNCTQAKDTVKIFFGPPPTVTASSATDTSCVTQPFAVTGNSSTGSGVWTTSGSGVFNNATQPSTIYNPGVNDATAGTVTLYFNTTNNAGCRSYKDSVQVTLLPAPLAVAGPDTTVCLNNATIQLHGQVALATGGTWATTGATPGILSNPNALNSTYTPSAQEIAQGYADLVLTGQGLITSCPANSDTIRINYVTGPTANAGPDAYVCKDTISVPLTGVVTVAGGGTWSVISGSTGTITNPNSLTNAVYVPSTADISNGVAHVSLQTTLNGSCIPTADTVDIFFANIPNVIASSGNDTSCVSLPFSVSGTSSTNSGAWTSSGDGGFADSSQATTVYSPGVNDATNGSVTLYYNSTNNGGCKSHFDSVTVIILAAPLANAGNDTVSCLNSPITQLNGQVALASGGVWSTTGATPGSFNNTTILNPIYTPSAQEIAQGYADVVLTGQGLIVSCPAQSDTLRISFIPGPTATIQSVGDTLNVCQDTNLVNLTAAITLATGANWTTNGTGTFTPAAALTTQYVPSQADVSSGVVTLYVSTTGNGLCTQSTDSLKLVFYAVPTLSVTSLNDTACTSNTMPIHAITSTGSGYWSTSGNGIFLPDSSALAASYTMGSADGNLVDLVFNTTNNNGCKTQRDTLKINIVTGPNGAFSNTGACPNATMNFTDASTITPGFVTGWQWDFGDLSAPVSGTTTPNHNYTNSGTYTVTLITTSNNGCTDTLQQPITVYNKPVPNFTNPIVCLYQATQFTDASTVVGSTITGWNWNFGNGTSTQQNPVDSFNVQTGNNVTLIAMSAQGCKDSITRAIGVLPQPVANFSADDYTAIVGQQINFTDLTTPGGSASAWDWNFSDNSSDALTQNPSHIYNIGGIYPVIFIVTDVNGCKDTVTKDIVVAIPPQVPTGFSPNGDGSNDVFYVLGGPFTTCHFRVYNNWGELIFESFDQKIGWDGTYKGAAQPMGVYVWVVDTETENGDKDHKSGDVTLLR